MDSRKIPPQPPSPSQPSPGVSMSHYRSPNATALMFPTSPSPSSQHQRPTFVNLDPQQQQSQTFHQQRQQQQTDQQAVESLGFGHGSPSSTPMRFGIQDQNQQTQVTKKRGRPRKYTDNGSSIGDSGGGGGNGHCADPPAKRNRGRPPGSKKKQLDALGVTTGVGFTAHVIEVKTGEDIASKVMAFADQGPRTVCIISANGAVTIGRASLASGIVNYEGQFEIITLSGAFCNHEANGSSNRSGSLSVTLAGPDGQIVGGIVVGPLVAVTQVQVTVGSFVAEAKKPKESLEPASAPARMLNVGSSESTGENESDSQPQVYHPWPAGQHSLGWRIDRFS